MLSRWDSCSINAAQLWTALRYPEEDAQLACAVQICRLKQRFRQALKEGAEHHRVPRAAGDARQDVDPDRIRKLVILGENDVVRDHAGAEKHGEEDEDRDRSAEAEIAPGKRIRRQRRDQTAEDRAGRSLEDGHAVGAQHAGAAGKRRFVRIEREVSRQQ